MDIQWDYLNGYRAITYGWGLPFVGIVPDTASILLGSTNGFTNQSQLRIDAENPMVKLQSSKTGYFTNVLTKLETLGTLERSTSLSGALGIPILTWGIVGNGSLG